MKASLIVAVLLIGAAPPLYAQAQQPDMDKLKADAQKVVSIIKGDKTKAEAYCQINQLGERIGDAQQEKDSKKAEELSRRVMALEIKLGPDYLSLVNGLRDVESKFPAGSGARLDTREARRRLRGR